MHQICSTQSNKQGGDFQQMFDLDKRLLVGKHPFFTNRLNFSNKPKKVFLIQESIVLRQINTIQGEKIKM